MRKRLKEGSVPTLFLSKEDNFVSDLQDDSLESIKKSEILNSLAKKLRQFRDQTELRSYLRLLYTHLI